LNDLILLISPYCNRDNEFRTLCEEMSTIREKYSDITIKYTQGEPVTVEKDGRLEIVQTESSEVEMTPEQLEGIVETTKDIRNRLVLNK
jgi:hypothetical protein